jgi:hypothetical protein
VLTETNAIAMSELHREHTGELSSSFILHILFVLGPLVADVICVGLQVSDRPWMDVACVVICKCNYEYFPHLSIMHFQNFDQQCFRCLVWRHVLWQ